MHDYTCRKSRNPQILPAAVFIPQAVSFRPGTALKMTAPLVTNNFSKINISLDA